VPDIPAEAVQAAANAALAARIAREASAAGTGSPASCPSAAPESTQSPESPSAAPVYPPGPTNPAETLSALRDAIARVRELADRLGREPHPTHDHLCPDDLRAELLAALDGAGAVSERTGPQAKVCSDACKRTCPMVACEGKHRAPEEQTGGSNG
jgi:hypothetical protein